MKEVKIMTVGELMKELSKYPENLEVMTKKHNITGNIGFIDVISNDSYAFFGKDIPCLILEDL